jgi:trehalose utilization protein
MPIRVTVWNEYKHERENAGIRAIYPDGIHGAIAAFLGENADIVVRTATLDMPEHGLTTEVLDGTDVLVWWGHMAHGQVDDAIVDRVQDRVLRGMGLIVLHSGHLSKIFRRLMGTSCNLTWRDDDRERIWCCMPSHPIAQGLPPSFEILDEEMYCEHFDIPQPDELVFLGWFKGGEVFRSGCCFHRGYGKVFYFQPGHEAHPTYRDNACVQRVITNAVRWAVPANRIDRLDCYRVEPAEASHTAR